MRSEEKLAHPTHDVPGTVDEDPHEGSNVREIHGTFGGPSGDRYKN